MVKTARRARHACPLRGGEEMGSSHKRLALLRAWIAAFLLAAMVVGASGSAAVAKPSGSWQIVAPLPQDLFGGASASDGTYEYVFGGYSFTSIQTLDTVYRYNPATNAWSSLAPLPQR